MLASHSQRLGAQRELGQRAEPFPPSSVMQGPAGAQCGLERPSSRPPAGHQQPRCPIPDDTPGAANQGSRYVVTRGPSLSLAGRRGRAWASLPFTRALSDREGMCLPPGGRGPHGGFRGTGFQSPPARSSFPDRHSPGGGGCCLPTAPHACPGLPASSPPRYPEGQRPGQPGGTGGSQGTRQWLLCSTRGTQGTPTPRISSNCPLTRQCPRKTSTHYMCGHLHTRGRGREADGHTAPSTSLSASVTSEPCPSRPRGSSF